jgi:hexosaminidase
MFMRFLICLVFVIVGCSATNAQESNIIPRPKNVSGYDANKFFPINPATLLVLEGSNMNNAVSFFNDYLHRYYGFRLKTVSNSSSGNTIRLNYEMMENPVPGAYRMEVNNKGVYIAGDNENGVFYGIQSLIQLLPLPSPQVKQSKKLPINYQLIEDAPRFAYRGLHLDCSRHFWPVDFVKKYIDYIALHKMNYFHWHLTDDQGWRIEIKKYPKLTSIGGWRNGTIIGRYPGTGNDGIRYGGFYTQDQVKEIVAYAAKRYITVVPEIEMPGHSSAAIAAYPELSCFPDSTTEYPKQCAWSGPRKGKHVQQTWGVFDDVFCAGKENTFNFLENVMAEVLTLFPSQFIHVGGDECPKEHWKHCPACQQRMKENKLKDEHELQSYFIQRMEKYLNTKGRTLIGWDEILEGGLAPNAVVMSWRGEKGGIEAAKDKHNVIMTPGNPVYFDHTQTENEDSVVIGGYNPIEKVYAYEPVPKELSDKEEKYVLGAQANMWAEYFGNTRKVEYMLFPRLSALSEVLWSPKSDRNWQDFERRLPMQFKRYDVWKANYSKAYFDLKATVMPASDGNGVEWKLESTVPGTLIRYSKDLSAGDPPNPPAFHAYDQPVKIMKGGNYNGWTVIEGKRSGNILTQKFSFNKATGKTITLKKDASKSYPGDGAFTLVNGVQNEKGFVRAKEFLGFAGDDCEGMIDLGSVQTINTVIAHVLTRVSSWIWEPSAFEVFISEDGKNFKSGGLTDYFRKTNEKTGNGIMQVKFDPTPARYIKFVLKSMDNIPPGNPGAGKKPWVFVDEIEVL